MIIRYLPWDSDFFGFRIGCYTKHTLNDIDESMFLKEFESQRYDCVYVFADPCDETAKQIAMRSQFLFVDERLVYYLPDNYQKHNISSGSYCLLDYSNKRALECARSIIDDISSVSRFTHDPQLRDKVKQMYALWFDQMISDQSGAMVIIPEKQSNLPVALVGCSVADNIGALVLVGVDSRFRGKGLGAMVVKSAIWWLYEHGAKRIKVKTQASADSAVSLYEKAGFVLEASQTIYHVWRKSQ